MSIFYCRLLLLSSLLIISFLISNVNCFTKVLVPSISHEFHPSRYPFYITDKSIQEKYNFTTFVYQKQDPNLPNYLSRNHGTEGGVYLKYIVDHYYDFPDVAIFVHGHPHKHSKNWLDLLGCISPNATYISINLPQEPAFRSTDSWEEWAPGCSAIWVEQCIRDVLRIVWNMESDNQTEEFEKLVPIDRPISFKTLYCQQFLLSRELVHRRSLSVWRKLLKIVYEQDVCHIGELDYEHLYSYFKHNKTKTHPEEVSIPEYGDKPGQGYGYHTQGGAMEHLAHVIFGQRPLIDDGPSREEFCQNFLPNCPHSPCQG